MNKIKDILYDTNDILIALIILALAALVIFSRVDAIMAYPEKSLAAAGSSGGPIRASSDDGLDAAGSGEGGSGGNGESSDTPSGAESSGMGSTGSGNGGAGESPQDGQAELYSVYIAYNQPMGEVAQTLISLGFFETAEEFFAALEEHNAATKVQAGNFIIPSDATTEELIDIITKPGL